MPPVLRTRVHSLPSLLDDPPWQLSDHYLWADHCPTNVKLRAGDLKLKRFLGRRGDLERWLEDENELFPFPLAREIVQEAARALGVVLPRLPAQPLEREALLGLLAQAEPPVRVITVRKSRWLHRLDLPYGLAAVSVELAEVSLPKPTTSLALEHPDLSAVRWAKTTLNLDRTGLRPLNYLQALALWAQGAAP
jgi:hypothetical protein